MNENKIYWLDLVGFQSGERHTGTLKQLRKEWVKAKNATFTVKTGSEVREAKVEWTAWEIIDPANGEIVREGYFEEEFNPAAQAETDFYRGNKNHPNYNQKSLSPRRVYAQMGPPQCGQ